MVLMVAFSFPLFFFSLGCFLPFPAGGCGAGENYGIWCLLLLLSSSSLLHFSDINFVSLFSFYHRCCLWSAYGSVYLVATMVCSYGSSVGM